MAATIDIDRMIEICFAAQFFVYGYMALFLYPYNDYDAVLHMRHTGSKPYLRGRRVLAVVYIFLGIAAGFGLCPASPSNGSAADGWASPLVPACLTLFFTAHAGMLLGLCDYAITERKNDLFRLLPLPVLCALYAAFPAWSEAIAVLQSVHLVAFIGWYTPLFYRAYDNLNRCCWDAVNETSDDVAPDYDCLPESMPWIGRRYIGLLIITLLALLAHFLPYGWTAYVMAILFTGYLFCFFYWVFLRFPRFARALFYYMNEEER